MKERKETRVCNCGAPLHWTFLFDGAEYFCMNCGASYGMLGAGRDVSETVETRARQQVAGDVFKVLRGHLWGSGEFTRSNCKKCKEGKDMYHTDHATKYERTKNDVAEKILKAIKGSLSPSKKNN